MLTDKRGALFFIPHYYKAYPTLPNMSLYFRFSDFAVSVYLERLKLCLKAALRVQAGSNRVLFAQQVQLEQQFASLENLVMDVTEITIERSANQHVQEEYYSGKKRHTLKWLVTCILCGRLV